MSFVIDLRFVVGFIYLLIIIIFKKRKLMYLKNLLFLCFDDCFWEKFGDFIIEVFF